MSAGPMRSRLRSTAGRDRIRSSQASLSEEMSRFIGSAAGSSTVFFSSASENGGSVRPENVTSTVFHENSFTATRRVVAIDRIMPE